MENTTKIPIDMIDKEYYKIVEEKDIETTNGVVKVPEVIVTKTLMIIPIDKDLEAIIPQDKELDLVHEINNNKIKSYVVI